MKFLLVKLCIVLISISYVNADIMNFQCDYIKDGSRYNDVEFTYDTNKNIFLEDIELLDNMIINKGKCRLTKWDGTFEQIKCTKFSSDRSVISKLTITKSINIKIHAVSMNRSTKKSKKIKGICTIQ